MFVGFVSLVRPLDGAILAALLGAWTLVVSHFTNITVGSLLVFVLRGDPDGVDRIAVYKAVTLVDMPLTYYYDKYFWPGANAIGFGANRGPELGPRCISRTYSV